MRHARIIEEIHRHQWAITPAAIEAIVRIVTIGEQLEERSIFHGSTITVEERQTDMEAALPVGPDSESYQFSQRFDNVGVINVDGPTIPRKAGNAPSQPRLTTTQGLMSDFDRMDSDPRIDRIAFISDSPGGAVTGTSELAARIHDSDKPVVTFVEGVCASADYWRASAGDAIVGADTSHVGSIGVIAKIKTSKDKDGVEIVSSQSEFKNPDLETEEGKAIIQTMVDDTADVFVNATADYRGTTRENVLENYGKGSIIIASRALAKGMIDGVMTRRQFMREFSGDLDACTFMTGSKSKKRRRLNASKEIDISAQHGEIEESDTAIEQAAENPNEGVKTMDLEQFLAENPAARIEFDKAIVTARAEACKELHASLGPVAKIVAGTEYADSIRAMGAQVFEGKQKLEIFEAVIAIEDAKAEKENSTAAVVASTAIPATPADSGSASGELSTDGKIRTTADFLRETGKELS